MTWSLAGKYPRILEDEVVGVEAQRLFKDANDMLDKLSAEKTLNPRGVVGLFPPTPVNLPFSIASPKRGSTRQTSCLPPSTRRCGVLTLQMSVKPYLQIP